MTNLLRGRITSTREEYNASDSVMLDLLCEYLSSPDLMSERGIIPFMEGRLTDIDSPVDRDPMSALWLNACFTNEDRETMLQLMTEEIRDSAAEHARSALEGETDIVELISYLPDDPELIATWLSKLGNPVEMEHFIDEYFRDPDGITIDDLNEFAIRMELIKKLEDEDGECWRVTPRGDRFIDRNL